MFHIVYRRILSYNLFFPVNNFHFSMTVSAFLQTVFTSSQLSPKCLTVDFSKSAPNLTPFTASPGYFLHIS